MRCKKMLFLSNVQKWRLENDGRHKIPSYRELPSNLFSMVIVDEAHHVPAPQWREIIDKFQKHAKIVFFTATPERADKQ